MRKSYLSKQIALYAALFISCAGFAQNLVPSPSFENNTCPTGLGQIGNVVGWSNIGSHTGSPDLLDACVAVSASTPNNAFGTQAPITGDAYLAFLGYSSALTDWREYAMCQLISPMVAGQDYCVSLHTSVPDNFQLGFSNALGICFTNTPVAGAGNNSLVTSVTPQIVNTTPVTDKTIWTQLTFTYTAVGGEQYMTLGNFNDDASTTLIPSAGGSFNNIFLYIEDVSVEVIVDPVITPSGPHCTVAAPLNLAADLAGGTWSGTGITDASAGTFDPATAGLGTHTITYTMPGVCGGTQTESIVVNDCSLPVELLTFDAEAMDQNNVALTWTTVNEIDNDYFEIERSRDGTNFSTINTAVDGAGNSTQTLTYNDIDSDPYPGISYYRLKQTDFDGTYTYSEIRSVMFDDLSFVSLHPNPADGEVNFTVLVNSESNLHVQIVDVTGRTVLKEDYMVYVGENTLSLNVANIASGMYTIRVNTNDQNHLSKEFIRR